MITRLRSESGQALVLVTVFMVVLLGGAAMSIDAGSWYLEHRRVQATADAAALAGAQALPASTVEASGLAKQYGAANGSNLDAVDIGFKNGLATDDTITVRVTREAPAFFAKLFKINSVKVSAVAAARAGLPSEARWVAPITVHKLHPKLSGPGCPCFEVATTLPLGKTGAPGAFAIVNLDHSANGTIGTSLLADWIRRGFDKYLKPDDYYSDPGAKWNSSEIQDALADRLNGELLFPVYDELTGQGANAEYHVIGWVGFRVSAHEANGSSGSISGVFTRVVWDAIQSTVATPTPDYGVRAVNLVR
jgi:Flp pilus assembly protein TadG